MQDDHGIYYRIIIQNTESWPMSKTAAQLLLQNKLVYWSAFHSDKVKGIENKKNLFMYITLF